MPAASRRAWLVERANVDPALHFHVLARCRRRTTRFASGRANDLAREMSIDALDHGERSANTWSAARQRILTHFVCFEAHSADKQTTIPGVTSGWTLLAQVVLGCEALWN
jgi:hypothetical protein